MNKNFNLFITTPLIIFILILGWIVIKNHRGNRPTSIIAPIEIRENSSQYSFINPLLFSRVSKGFYNEEFKSFNNIIISNIKSLTDSNTADFVSVYLRDLNTGHWTGVNEDEKYHPSSMLKVLGMMSYFKRTEKEPVILYKKLYYEPKIYEGQYYKPDRKFDSGLYSIEELIKNMIIYSDNSVLNILDEEDMNNIFNKIYNTFQLPLSTDKDDIDGFMSPRSYSALFRILYNSTYLSRNLSEKALKLLTQTTFNKGLVDGVPKDTVVAHKFGEYTYEMVNNKIERRELHDCGIVYYPNHPYLICIMTRGSDFSRLEFVIKSISKTVYDYWGQKYKYK